jgi:dolichyl-diphosphooligosaccharide--protein glycosyltransferase
MKSYLERIRRFGYAAPALAFIFALSLIIRMLPYDKVFVNGEVIFYEVDPYFFIRNIMYTTSHFPGVLQADYYQNYPGGGGGTYPFYILMASSIALIAGLGSPSPHTVEVVTALLPPVIGALTIFPVYFIGKELFDSKAGIDRKSVV